ncbi:MAG TPA: hypothetical protein VIV40_14175, partial [Kofleriaceae bacterium]
MRMLLLLCVACGSVEGKGNDAAVHDTSGTDTRPIDSAAPPCDVTKPFGTPVLVQGVNTANQERWGFLSGDELTIYFSDQAAVRSIYSATRSSTSAAFGTPMVVAGINSTTASHEHAAVTADGLTIVADMPASSTNTDVGIVARASSAQDFGPLVSAANVNTGDQELDPFISADGLTL